MRSMAHTRMDGWSPSDRLSLQGPLLVIVVYIMAGGRHITAPPAPSASNSPPLVNPMSPPSASDLPAMPVPGPDLPPKKNTYFLRCAVSSALAARCTASRPPSPHKLHTHDHSPLAPPPSVEIISPTTIALRHYHSNTPAMSAALPGVPRRHSVAPALERWMQHIFTDSNSPSTPQRIHNPLDPRYLGNVPFSFTTDKLREWGSVYLRNSATADAFIRAIPAVKEEVTGETEVLQKKRMVRVKVCRPRRSFYMQKAFPIRPTAVAKTAVNRISKAPQRRPAVPIR